MTFVPLSGQGLYIPPIIGASINPSLATTLTISSANINDKIAQIGRVSFAERTGSKTITKVHFLFGFVSKANGSTLRVSLQDVDLTAGPVIRPDGTADQSVTIANADAGFVSSSWYTATLGSSRSVTYGDLLAIVFDWGTPVTGDSVTIAGLSVSSAASNGGAISQQYTCSLFTSSTWSTITMQPNILLEFNDGTFGTLDGAHIVSAIGSLSVSSSTTPDEYCLEFQLPFAAEVDGMWSIIAPQAGADLDIVLYDGTTALATVTVDNNAILSASARFIRVSFPKVSLNANQTYRIAIKPSTTNTTTVYYADVSVEAHMGVLPLGTSAQINSRTDSGAWGTATQTRRLWAGVRVCSIDVTPSGGGGGSGGSFAFIG